MFGRMGRIFGRMGIAFPSREVTAFGPTHNYTYFYLGF